MTAASPVLGIFVGGESKRMGSPKGALRVPGSTLTILEALVAAGTEAGMAPVLVGDASQYAALVTDVARIEDRPPGTGPLAGLHAVLHHARGADVVAVACDMPHIDAAVLREVLGAERSAPIVAARRGADAPWEPMLARFESGAVCDAVARAIENGVRSFQQLFSILNVAELPLTPTLQRALTDWDTPDDLLSSPP